MKQLKFIPQLDSFRFFAVMLVILAHWLPGSPLNRIPNGFLGVVFFFVLSGYLISTNLLYLKRSIGQKEISVGQAFKIFYIRRSLRIFPLYYLVLFLLYLINSKIFRGDMIWYVTYLPNILMFKEKIWPGMLSHLWSLGVEEQFYLVWPLLIFIVKEKWLKYLFPGTIILSILFKLSLFHVYSTFFTFDNLLPFCSFDAFGVGAVLAFIPFSDDTSGNWSDRIPFSLGVLCSLILGTLVYMTGMCFLFAFFISAASFFIIRQAQKGFTGLVGFILDQPAIQYLGRISYGLYIYHNFMPWLWQCITGRERAYPLSIPTFNSPWLTRPVVALSAQFILLIVISSISWYVVERPFNNLKNAAIIKTPLTSTFKYP